jgi:hypothetical protein
MEEFELDYLKLNKRIIDTWISYVPYAVKEIREKYKDIKQEEMSTEKFRVLPNGNGELFVQFRDCIIKLAVPKNEFEFII